MKKYVVYAPHKCGSTIINKILNDVFNLENGILAKSVTINTDSGKAKLQFERFIRPNKPKNPVDFNKDDFIFIPRNPIGITMSMFYSFGYTHKCPKHMTEEQFYLWRQKIQKTGLHNYIENNISRLSTKIENFWNLPMTSKTILPYEFMLDNFSKFLKELLQALDMTSVYDKTYEKWKGSFAQIEDKSDLIEAGKLKVHKRTTDIYEWKKKLDEDFLVSLLKECPFISEYDKYLKEWL